MNYPQIQQAIEIMHASRRITAFSGAGISTEAGIPDFRGKGGMWENEQLMEQMSARGFNRDPAGFYRAALKLLPVIHRAEPTSTHRLLAELEAKGQLIAVITQNIDGLHQAAGSSRVYEIHGNFRTGRCLDCRTAYSMIEFYNQIERGELSFPICTRCTSPVKPDVVLFGDFLPLDQWNASKAVVEDCDLLLVLGSSLVVYPAADLPKIAVARGAKLIIINREPTDFDEMADVVVHAELRDFARRLLREE